MKKKTDVRKITVTAMLSAVAFLLMFVEFPVPFMPPFIKMDISDLPALLGTFSLGPIAGIVIEFIKNLLHILIKGTSSAGVGELSNFLLGCFMVVPAGLIYKKHKSRLGAVAASVIGCAIMGVMSFPLNYFIVYPAYVKFYGLPLPAIIGMYQKIWGGVNGLAGCLLIFNVPFTFLKGIVDSIICYVIYKPLSPVLHGRK